MPASRFRDDITVIGVPLTAICNREYSDPRQRQLFKNIIYVGALSALLDMDVEVIEQLIGEQFKSKEKLIGANRACASPRPRLGTDELAVPDRACALRRANAVGDRIFIEGNSRGCARRGLRRRHRVRLVSDHAVLLACRCFRRPLPRGCASIRDRKRASYAIIQAEDELASIGMVIGAAWNGARAFTATSGPGISLMQEFLGLAYFAEIPAVIFDVQRAGPSTGMPTRTQQCDLISLRLCLAWRHQARAAVSRRPAEAFDFAADAFDLADRLQTPIFVMLDLDIGMNHRLCRPLPGTMRGGYDRGKVMTAAELEAGKEFGRYLDVDGDGIPYRTLPGTHPSRGAFFTRGIIADRYARYTEEGAVYADNMQRLLRKFETAKELVPRPRAGQCGEADQYGVLYYGSTSPAMDEAIHMIEARGHALDRLRVRAFPFHLERHQLRRRP